jgi:CDP-glycerol glycerophosphotransferase
MDSVDGLGTTGQSAEATPTPDVSVVVIVYNDAARLPAAVKSVLDQTLHNLEVVIVDDHSSDDTPKVAATLAEHPKVSYLRLEENSGGCSRPRNAGIDRARGTYVMFLDSDDTLDRHACLNMLTAAESSGADLVSGVCVRVHLNRSGVTNDVPWWPDLYAEARVLESISDMPDLLRDTLSTNKCYRRAFLNEHDLRFPEGYHYEDLLFSAKAYLAADGIAVIPDTIYYWNVVVRAAQKSISNRRGELSNVRDRLAIHRLIDAELAARIERRPADREIKVTKDVKFIEHDLVLYLRDLPYQEPDYIAECTALFRDYLRTLTPESFDRCRHRVAVAGAYLLLEDDWDNLTKVAENLMDRTRITADLVERDGRIYWCAQHLDTERGRAALDVTELGWQSADIAGANLAARLIRLEPQGGGRVRLTGQTLNPLGRIPADAELSVQLEFRPGQRAVRGYRVNAAEVRHLGARIEWTALVDLTRTVKPLGLIDQVWEIKARLTVAGQGTTVSKIAAVRLPVESGGGFSAPARPLLTRAVGDRWVAGINHRGLVVLTLTAHNPLARAVNAPLDRALSGQGSGRILRVAQQVYRRVRVINDPRVKREVFAHFLRRLPIRRGSVVFESHLGLSYSDSPKYISEALRAAGYRGRVYWSHAKGTQGFPTDASLVRRNSWSYLRALARAEYWVDNQGFPQWIGKRAATTYIQTWHGTPLKTMGVHTPQIKAMLTPERERFKAAVNRFDHFLVRSEYDVRNLIEAFEARAEPLRVGYPRNDALLAADRAERAAALRDRFGFPADRRILLYAPTFRTADASFEIGFDLDEFAREFGRTHLLVVRAHYLNTVRVPLAAKSAVLDLSSHPDVTELMLASDALITDYSSVMFDYALLDRPMVFFVPDAAGYSRDRGTYFDLADRAPGPYTTDQGAFFEALRTLPGDDAAPDPYRTARKTFAHEFGEYETGTAAQQIVQRFFTGNGKGKGAGR